MKKIRTLIADDHSVVRIGLTALLNTVNDIEVVGEAEDGEVAVRKSLKLKPDVVILDMMMPALDGVSATSKIRTQLPGTRVLILTTFASPDSIRQALDAGASGALLKSAADADLIDAVRRIARGETVISDEVNQLILNLESAPVLTNRQLEILHHVTRGRTNKEIATLLGIREDSVGQHLSAIFTKLGAATRAEAVAIALRKHLLKI